MASVTIRLLPFQTDAGPRNMALDEALLYSAEQGVASFRFYAWSHPTLSLGYFQPSSVRSYRSEWAGLPWVRRASGGRTLLHHRELTYCLALPGGLPWQDKTSWLIRMHEVIQAALGGGGQNSPLSLHAGPAVEQGEVLCFQHVTPGDLVSRTSKIVGSAQRKLRGCLLQHGAILLGRSEFAPELPGLTETNPGAASRLEIEPIIDGVMKSFTAKVGWQFQPGDWTAEERKWADSLVEEKYGNSEWNEKR